jgi:hypothetical protein
MVAVLEGAMMTTQGGGVEADGTWTETGSDRIRARQSSAFSTDGQANTQLYPTTGRCAVSWAPSHLACECEVGPDGGSADRMPRQASGWTVGPLTECRIWARFSTFVDTVCQQCEYSHGSESQCGCEVAQDNVAVWTLQAHVHDVLQYFPVSQEGLLLPPSPDTFIPRVIVEASGGLGNQLFSIINGLIPALFMQRPLVVRFRGGQQYGLDSVLDVGPLLASHPCRSQVTRTGDER